MKKLLICVLLLLLILYGIFSLMPEDEVLHSLGKSKTHVLYSEGGFHLCGGLIDSRDGHGVGAERNYAD